MAQAEIPFIPNGEPGDSVVSGAQPLPRNVLVDGRGAIRRRPAIVASSFAPSSAIDAAGLNSIHAYQDKLFVTSPSRTIYRISGGVATSLGGTYATQLAGSLRPHVAETIDPYLVYASGLTPQKVDPVALTSSRLGGSPPDSTQMVFLASRLISDEPNGPIIGGYRYSNPATTTSGTETWDALRRGSTQADSDQIVAIRSNLNELFIWGTRTLQVFSPDPNVIWSPLRSQRIGCASAHSVVEVDSQFILLDNRRRFIITDGRSVEDISTAISTELEAMTVSDCFGFRVDRGQFNCVAWKFPAEKRCLVYQASVGWSEWNSWNGTQYTELPVNAHFYWPEQDTHLVGLNDGRLAELSTTAQQDIDETPIRAEITTGFTDRGTASMKSCRSVAIYMRRGQATSGKIGLQWRDDVNGAWSRPLWSDFSGKHDPVVLYYSLGVYRMRQWRLIMDEAADLEVARVVEDYEVQR